MGNPFNSPFNPCGVLQHLRIELNVTFMKRLEHFFQKLKGQFNKGIGLNYKLIRSKLMFMQKYFGFQIAASTEMQSKVAIQFSRSNLMKDGFKQTLAIQGNLFKFAREKRNYKDIQLLKTTFAVGSILEIKNDIAMQQYIVHNTTSVSRYFYLAENS